MVRGVVRDAPYTTRSRRGGTAGGTGSTGSAGNAGTGDHHHHGGPMRASGRRPHLSSAARHEQQQQQQQQQYTQASSRTWRSSALRERLQHFLMESPARPFVEQQQQQQLQQQQQQQQFRGGLSSRQVGAVSPSAAASRAGSFLESHVRDDAADADDEEEEEDDDLASVQGTTGGSLVGSARAHDDSLNLSSTTGGNLAARHSGRGTADSANSSFTQRALNLSNASLSTTRDEMVAAMEHRIMALEAEKIDMHAAKLHAEHELKAVKAQLEREQIELARQRDAREKGVFNNNVREFREACYELLGYQIDVVQASRYRLHSMYAESADDYLLFASSPQGLQLLETQFSASLDERILANLHRFHSIPAFLSAITVDLFSKSTMA
ncbi:hypothetical protein PTSG_02142 [Salpingoeca rosetta]|uniref:Uncharacterized protein n=1 Tax=Salpingoeca rosetta (strain ATCC 50818 / BSB-021) TaxID=946362 RepID=F2U1C0_SALR5|nr:uncharacterized protein PTSG_02142 [Salpingoeca rosetta]EGD81422.1 hypothetical protein PTSG_02142 [Salpingoeca rosetta]|eukprot:XP_004996626.1 hypothetical protein PTSG_02142 [Salpingoeca rosetta]